MEGLLTSAIPTLFNVASQMYENSANRNFYQQQQERANQFAVEERMKAQEYNSPRNQIQMMRDAGLNPNLLTGTMFQATSPVPNQSVSPPQGIAPSMPANPVSADVLNFSTAKDLQSQQISRDALLDGLLKTQQATYNYIVSNTKVNEQTIKNLQKNFELLDETIKQVIESVFHSQQERALMDAQTKGQNIQNDWMPRINDAQIKKFASDMGVNRAQMSFLYANADQLRELTKGVMFNNYMNNANKWYIMQMPRLEYEGKKQSNIRVKVENDKFRFDFGKHKTYYDIDKAVQYMDFGMKFLDWSYNSNPLIRGFHEGKDLLPWATGGSPTPSSPSIYAPSSSSSSW